MPLIIKKIKNSIPKAVKEMLRELNYIPENKKIFIKPNIAIPTWPDAPYITNPQVVLGVIDYLKEIGIGDIIVGEGPVPIDFSVEDTFDVTGYGKICRDCKVPLLDLHLLPRKKVKRDDFEISLPDILFEREYINISKFKTHYQTTVTLGLKNQKGLLAPGDKNFFHGNLHENIAKLYSIIKPSLSIIDGVNGLEGNGPVDLGDEISKLDLLVAGTDMLETDKLACRIMGIDSFQVEHIFLASKIDEIKKEELIFGEKIEDVIYNFRLPSLYWKRGNIYYFWSDYTCSRCSLIESRIMEKLEELSLEILNKIPFTAFITGKPKTDIPDHFNIYPIGKCASLFRKKPDFEYMNTCPPRMEDVCNILSEICNSWSFNL